MSNLIDTIKTKLKARKSLDDLTTQVNNLLHPKYGNKMTWDAIRYNLKKGTFDPKSVRKRD